MGRVKPDLLAPSMNLYSSSGSAPYRCVTLTGTSVATPVVTGAVAVLLSYAFDPIPLHLHNTSASASLPGVGAAGVTGVDKNSSDILSANTKYNRRSPRFLRYKNIAAIKQIILSSTRLSADPGSHYSLSLFPSLSSLLICTIVFIFVFIFVFILSTPFSCTLPHTFDFNVYTTINEFLTIVMILSTAI